MLDDVVIRKQAQEHIRVCALGHVQLEVDVSKDDNRRGKGGDTLEDFVEFVDKIFLDFRRAWGRYRS